MSSITYINIAMGKPHFNVRCLHKLDANIKKHQIKQNLIHIYPSLNNHY